MNSGWAALALGNDLALRLDPRYGPFGATMDQTQAACAMLRSLAQQNDELWLVGVDAGTSPPGMIVTRTATLAQMVAVDVPPGAVQPPDWLFLGDEDAADMLELAQLTKPGPFREMTHRLGRFIGVREGGTLIAMAGERMRMPGFTEVSGVCTHPDWRGRGLAGTLMRIVARGILERGEIPFLHAYAAHDQTIVLYRSLGFEIRAQLPMMVVSSSISAKIAAGR